MNARYLNVSHPVKQRAIDDVLVRVTEVGVGTSVVMYMSRGRAEFALARYPKGSANLDQRYVVERLVTKAEGS